MAWIFLLPVAFHVCLFSTCPLFAFAGKTFQRLNNTSRSHVEKVLLVEREPNSSFCVEFTDLFSLNFIRTLLFHFIVEGVIPPYFSFNSKTNKGKLHSIVGFTVFTLRTKLSKNGILLSRTINWE